MTEKASHFRESHESLFSGDHLQDLLEKQVKPGLLLSLKVIYPHRVANYCWDQADRTRTSDTKVQLSFLT